MLEPMPTVESAVQAARRQLERVLTSAGFSRSERMARFLRFVVERHLESRDGELKESLIAVEVFDRSPNHDSKQDSIVRTEAARLRARLTEYYVGEGKGEDVVIELPKGGYVPVLRQASRQPQASLPRSRDSEDGFGWAQRWQASRWPRRLVGWGSAKVRPFRS